MRVLVIEDEASLREQIGVRLRQEGQTVDVVADGTQGSYVGNEFPIDVAVVDLGLPDVSGLEVIRVWREAGRTFPILILTARGKWQDKVRGLEAGADDYLVKPFHMEELLARIRALVRRSAGWADSVLRCGPVTLHMGRQIVQVEGQSINLTAYEYRVLEYLMLHGGDVISKTELSEHLYEDDFDRDSNVLEVLIGRLRKKLDPEKRLSPVETLRGRGYRFCLERDSG